MENQKAQVFLLENLSLIQTFLSLYDESRPTHLVATNIPVNKLFFGEFLGLRNAVFVPQTMMWLSGFEKGEALPPAPAHWGAWLQFLESGRPQFDAYVASLPRDAEVYWWHPAGPALIHGMIGRMKAAGLNCRFVRDPAWWDVFSLQYHNRDAADAIRPSYGDFLDAARRVMGMEMALIQLQPRKLGDWSHYAVGPSPAEYGGAPLTPNVRSWSELAQRFAPRVAPIVQSRRSARRRILVVDEALGGAGIDEAETAKAVHAYIRHCLDAGDEVHVKPHYHGPDHRTVKDPEIMERVTLLPFHIPAELLVDHYDIIHFFASSTSYRPTQARKISLLPLIRFQTQGAEDFYWTTMAAAPAEQWNSISFLREDAAGGYQIYSIPQPTVGAG